MFAQVQISLFNPLSIGEYFNTNIEIATFGIDNSNFHTMMKYILVYFVMTEYMDIFAVDVLNNLPLDSRIIIIVTTVAQC